VTQRHNVQAMSFKRVSFLRLKRLT